MPTTPNRKGQSQSQSQGQSQALPPADMAAAMAAETPAERLARLKAARAAAVAAAPVGATVSERKPISWPQDLLDACEALNPAFVMPRVMPSRGVSYEGICRGRKCFAVGPADSSALNMPIPTEPKQQKDGKVRHDEMIELIRSFIFNNYYGEPLHVGGSLASGAKVKLTDLLAVLPLGERYFRTKWTQTLWAGRSNDRNNLTQTSLLFKLAQISGRYAIFDCEDQTLQLVRDFFPQ